MNKSAEQQAEEMYPFSKDNGLMDNLDQFGKQEAFIAGHHSRDEEVNKLVEVLEDLVTQIADDIFNELGAETRESHSVWILKKTISKAKEALKPYQK